MPSEVQPQSEGLAHSPVSGSVHSARRRSPHGKWRCELPRLPWWPVVLQDGVLLLSATVPKRCGR